MANDVFRATDAILVLGVDDVHSAEGSAADKLISQYDLSNAVGRLRNVTVTVTADVKPFYEIGRRHAAALRPGLVSVSGTIERGHINGALLRLLLGDGAASPPGANFAQPAFNIISTLKDPSSPDGYTRVTVFGVRFDKWRYTVPTDDFVMEAASFQAMRVSFEEA